MTARQASLQGAARDGHPADRLRGWSALAWIGELSWVTSRRRWRQDSGALLLAAGLAVGLTMGTLHAPAGGEPLYLSLLFLVGLAAVVGAPLVLTSETIPGNLRFELLPLPGPTRWLCRSSFGNPLRFLLLLILAIWAAATISAAEGITVRGVIQWAQALGWLLVALSLSLLIEDVIRHRRSLVVHQLLFLAGLSTWPLLLEYLREPGNFLPPPSWTSGPLEPFLLGGSASPLQQGAVASVIVILAGLLIRLDRWFLLKSATRPPPPARSVGWTRWIAECLSRPFASNAFLAREFLVPLRFLFIRMSLVFAALVGVAALVFGLPHLLLSLVFWWQPLSTNALGPDMDGGTLRYRLLGWSPRDILVRRTVVAVILSVAIFGAVVVACGILGLVRRPVVGPETFAAYPIAFTYSLSLIVLWAIAGERYSLRFSDSLEMHTLLPERKRSGGARALVLLILMWGWVTALAIAALGAAYLVLIPFLSGTWSAVDLGLLAMTAAVGNLSIYLLHLRSFQPAWND